MCLAFLREIEMSSKLCNAATAAVILLFATPSLASADEPPQVVQVNSWTPGYDLWVIEGYVVDEDPVNFVDLYGAVYDATWTSETGYFQFVFHLPQGGFGQVEITAFDSAGQSGSATTFVLY